VIETLVEANGRFINGEPKTKGSRRTVPLPRRVVVELDNHLHGYVRTSSDALVFTGLKGASFTPGGIPPLLLAASHPEGRARGLEGPRAPTHLCGPMGGGRCQSQRGIYPSGSLVSCVHLDRYGHLYEVAGAEVPDRLDALLSAGATPKMIPKSVKEKSLAGSRKPSDLIFAGWPQGI